MWRRTLGLALLSLGLVVPASASAKIKAAAADPYKVLVVTSTTDADTAAGVAAITSAGSGGIYTVSAPAPAAVGAEFTPTNLDNYRAVVFLNTGLASPLTDTRTRELRDLLQEGRRLRRHRLRHRDRSELVVPDQRSRHALLEPDHVAERDGQGLRPRP